MIGQIKVLLRIKQLREEQAFRALQAKRGQVAEAQQRLVRAREAVAESAASLPAREDAIYAELLGKVVEPDAFDETRAKVVELEKAHARLKDEVERAAHVLSRLEEELQAAIRAHNLALKARDKYGIITDELVREALAIVDAKEEVEIEDLFSRGKKVPA
jgi:hypothetical protein